MFQTKIIWFEQNIDKDREKWVALLKLVRKIMNCFSDNQMYTHNI